MAWKHVMILGFVGLVVGPAAHVTRSIGSSPEAKGPRGNSTMDVGVSARCIGCLGAGLAPLKMGLGLGVTVLSAAISKLLKLSKSSFFDYLTRTFPDTANLGEVVKSPEPVQPETINQLLTNYCLSLRKKVSSNTIPKSAAAQLLKQTIIELKSALSKKMDVGLIDCKCEVE